MLKQTIKCHTAGSNERHVLTITWTDLKHQVKETYSKISVIWMQNKELDNFTTKQSRTYIKHIRLGTNESWEGESEWKLRQGMKKENDNPSNRNMPLSNTIPTLHLQCFRWSQHINCQFWWIYGKKLEIHFYETTEYFTEYLWFFLW